MSESWAEQQAQRAYAVIQQRHKDGLLPLSNTDLATILGYSRQQQFIPLIPILQRMAEADGFYLARPHASNRFRLTLLPLTEPELAALSELARDSNRATRQRNNVLGGLCKALSESPNKRIAYWASQVYIRDDLARQADDRARMAQRELAQELRMNLDTLRRVPDYSVN